MEVAINGFGRMGRNFLRAVHASQKDIEIVCINDLASPEVLAHMTKYDSIMGTFPKSVSHTDKGIRIEDKVVHTSAETDPARLPWKSFAIDVVIEATGRFTKAADARKHVDAGAHKVIISAPATDEDITIVMGVNDARFDRQRHTVVSCASCTTNCESLREPHVKHLEGRLWELRLTGRDGIARALYVTAIGRRVIVVRAFVKKTQKTPRAEIELALRRAKEIT